MDGTLRVTYPAADWTELLLKLSLTEPRHYGADPPGRAPHGPC